MVCVNLELTFWIYFYGPRESMLLALQIHHYEVNRPCFSLPGLVLGFHPLERFFIPLAYSALNCNVHV